MDSRKISKTEFIYLFRKNFQNEIKERALRTSGFFSDILDFMSKMSEQRKSYLANLVVDVIAETVYKSLAQANEQESIKISLFDGMDVEATYVPQKEKRNNLTGETIIVASKIKPKATFTRTCIDKLSKSVR